MQSTCWILNVDEGSFCDFSSSGCKILCVFSIFEIEPIAVLIVELLNLVG